MLSSPDSSPELSLGLSAEPFAPLQALDDWQRQLACLGLQAAAESQFIGRVRPIAGDGTPLQALELEHYPGMTEQQLQLLATDCAIRHGVLAVLVRHRVGRLSPGEAIVLVAVAADRRGPAQRCCQELLEALKHEAPFWKREWRADGSSTWLTGNTPLEAETCHHR
ncbi:MAG: molybdopterin synthase catalytic subunit [Cyanobacteriota bacterium]